ncbi:MAG: ABC transporter permease, partial [Caldisericia bacterium]|nr:ABC transporter permease [Caldisericia bacterium]
MIQRFFILLIISFLAFILLNAMSDPVEILKSMDPHITQQQIDIYKRQQGLDKPSVIRYVYWFKNAWKGDFGISRAYKENVFPLLMGRIPNTMYMQAIVLLIIVFTAIPLGIFSAVRQYSTWDYILTFFAFTGVSLPMFWVGLMVILWLGIGAGLPFTGMYSDIVTYGGQTMPYAQAPWFVQLGDRLMHLVLPVLTISMISLAGLMRYTRSALLEVIRQDYVRTARAKGVSEKEVIYNHALRNAMIPIATILIQTIPGLFAGSLIVEQIFGWPGVGKMVFDAVMQKDYNLAMMDLMFLSFLTVTFTLIADISYAFLD